MQHCSFKVDAVFQTSRAVSWETLDYAGNCCVFAGVSAGTVKWLAYTVVPKLLWPVCLPLALVQGK